MRRRSADAALPGFFEPDARQTALEGLLDQPDVNGGLIGGAALKADSFLAIVKAAV